MKTPSPSRTAFAVVALLAAALPAAARDRDRDRDSRSNVTVVVRPGHSVRALPRDNARVVVRDRAYFYHGGVFYESRGKDYVVVTAPLGARVRALPPGYVRFGIGGRDYFYFNATFWIWEPSSREYVVVEKPNGGDAALASAEQQVPAPAPFYVYPARGQSEEQTRQDRYECHVWAVDEANFDPATGDSDAAGYAEYRRATEACLEGRGYTVR
jgi:Family of unknown function (DUF6515)